MKDFRQLALMSAMALASGSLLIGCTVEQTEEGELPDVDMQVEGGNMPKYDVDAAEVEVGSRPAQVTVPTMDVDVGSEEKTVRVPTIDINTAQDDDELGDREPVDQ